MLGCGSDKLNSSFRGMMLDCESSTITHQGCGHQAELWYHNETDTDQYAREGKHSPTIAKPNRYHGDHRCGRLINQAPQAPSFPFGFRIVKDTIRKQGSLLADDLSEARDNDVSRLDSFRQL
jgi:hypothetical protein